MSHSRTPNQAMHITSRPRRTADGASFCPRRATSCILLLLLGLGACDRDAGAAAVTPNGSRLELPQGVQPVEFPVGTVQIQSGDTTHTLRAEFATTPAQRERGLMYRTSMPEDAGMLFIYPAEQEGGFWMYNTLIPLSIAYADENGVISQITQMEPCESPYASMCPTYPARVPFRYALEVNQGYYAARGIQAGDRILYEIED